MMTLIRRPADQGDGNLASLRTLSSQSGFRVLLYTIEREKGLSVASPMAEGDLLTGCWLTVAHVLGRRGPLGCLTNG